MIAAGHQDASAWVSVDDVIGAITAAFPDLAPIASAAPDAGLRLAGQKVPREPHRYSGRTAMRANVSVHEPKPPEDPDSALSFSMEGSPVHPPAALTPFFWAPGWNSIQAVTKYQREVNGPLLGGDAGVRLIEPKADRTGYSGVEPAAAVEADSWLCVALPHVFGSEELSLHAPGVAQLAPAPHVALNAAALERLHAVPGGAIDVHLGQVTYRLAVLLRPELPDGVAGLPIGIPPLIGIALPQRARLSRA
jgi:NADH-quinone oxidoreductase subunit G